MATSLSESISNDINGLVAGVGDGVGRAASSVSSATVNSTKFVGTTVSHAGNATVLLGSNVAKDVMLVGGRSARAVENVTTVVTDSANATKDTTVNGAKALWGGLAGLVLGTGSAVKAGASAVYNNTPVRATTEAVVNGTKLGAENLRDAVAPTLEVAAKPVVAVGQATTKVGAAVGSEVVNVTRNAANTTIGMGVSVVGAAGRTVGLVQ